MKDIVLVEGYVDFRNWASRHPDVDATNIRVFRTQDVDSLQKYVQSDSTALVGRYDVAPNAWRRGSDALHKCLSVLHDAHYVESNPDGWSKTCPGS